MTQDEFMNKMIVYTFFRSWVTLGVPLFSMADPSCFYHTTKAGFFSKFQLHQM